jgi:hypothetical protein
VGGQLIKASVADDVAGCGRHIASEFRTTIRNLDGRSIPNYRPGFVRQNADRS